MVVAGLPFIISGLLLIYGNVRKSNRNKAKQLFVFNIWVNAYAILYFILKVVFNVNLYLLKEGVIIQVIIPVGIMLMMDALVLSKARKKRKAEEEENLKAENMQRVLDDIARAEAEEAEEAERAKNESEHDETGASGEPVDTGHNSGPR
jgi:hypothetical protein